MNIVIIAPGHPGPDKKSLPPSLAAPYIAALATPYAEEIKIYDLAVEPFDFNAPIPDLVLATSTMAQFDHVCKIAEFLKARGADIIMGGPHATLAYDFDSRIREIADSVVLGEGEQALPRALEDFMNGNLQPTYSKPIDSLNGIPFSRLDLLDNRKYLSTTSVFGTRGCVNQCAYCSIRDIYGHKYLKRPVDELIEEIKFQTSRPNLQWLDRKLVQFWDDNPHCDLDWFHDLLEKMIPLKKWWLSQVCLNVADNEETVKLMKASGCKGVFVGIESISPETLKSQKKDAINIVDNYIRQTRTLLKYGMVIVGATMYGFDTDTKQTLFSDTLELTEKMGITMLQTHLVTPYPHSDYFKTLDRENRLITREARYYNGYTVVHRPRHIHPAELQEGFINIRKKFYSWRSIFRRMFKHNLLKYPEYLIWSAMFRTPNYEAVPGVDIEEWLKYLKTV